MHKQQLPNYQSVLISRKLVAISYCSPIHSFIQKLMNIFLSVLCLFHCCQQATISSDNHLRIYECLEQPSLTTWQLSEEVDVQSLPSTSSPNFQSRAHTIALATPTQTSATLEGASASLVAQALQQGLQQGPQSRPGLGNREADGGWCISWCKDRYWGEIIAAGCGIAGTVKVRPSFFLCCLYSALRHHTDFVGTDHPTLAFQTFHHAAHS